MKVHTRLPFWRRVLRAAGSRAFHFAENNGDVRHLQNGEALLMRQFFRTHSRSTPENPLIVFDVGANVGDYSRLALREARLAHHHVQLHVFEPSGSNAALLRKEFGKEREVHVVCEAVSDEPGEAVLYADQTGSSLASLIKRETFAGMPLQEHTVPVVRLDAYMAREGINRINLLKLDVEGAEMAALKSLGDRLQPAIVELIQFEYGGATLDAHTTLRELCDLFAGRGYLVGKLFPYGVEVRTYQPWMEHYTYANYAAISPELVKSGRIR